MKKRFTRPLLTCLLCLAAAMVQAQTLSVDEIVARHIESRGGYDKIRAIRTMVYSNGQYSEGDHGWGDAMMAFSRPFFRVVGNPKKPDGYMEGYDGSAWEWYADPGIVVRTVGAAAGATRRGADFEGPFVDYRDKGTRIRQGESQDIDGRPAYRLIVMVRDGFEREYFIDQDTFLVIAERRVAPIHAFGDPVTSETRVSDYRRVAGVLFAHAFVETDIATGESLNQMQWGQIKANRKLPASWFSPPQFKRTALQRFIEQLYAERADKQAVLWTYHEFRRAYPDTDTHSAVEVAGYQMLKMGDVDVAVALLEANAKDHPEVASSAFGLGRAYDTADASLRAKAEYERALQLDPGNDRARRALDAMDAVTVSADNPLSFLQPFIGSWKLDPAGEYVTNNPEMIDDIAFQLEWADPKKKILRFYEGIPDGDYDRRVLENLVTYNPRSGEPIALGYQLQNDFLYESTFTPQENGFIRLYKVTYPKEQQFRRAEDSERGWIQYRDRCELTAINSLHCLTEQMRDGQWQAWGSNEGYTVVRGT